jgi:hypothetical protein
LVLAAATNLPVAFILNTLPWLLPPQSLYLELDVVCLVHDKHVHTTRSLVLELLCLFLATLYLPAYVYFQIPKEMENTLNLSIL